MVYTDQLVNYCNKELYIAGKQEGMGTELYLNLCRLEWNDAAAKETTCDELKECFRQAKQSRKKRLDELGLDADLVYYLWIQPFDWNLRFSFGRSDHGEFPFDCELEHAGSEEELIRAFLGYDPLKNISLTGELDGV